MKRNKGFTLIELMVVIAIIAILATVVLVSLQSARDSAENSNRISAVSQIRSLAETYRAQDLDYEGLTDPPEELRELICEYGPGNFDGAEIGCDEDTHDMKDVLEIHIEEDDYERYCATIELIGDDETFCVDGTLTGRRYDEGDACTSENLSCVTEEE